MSEHRIRFRGGWEILLTAGNPVTTRLNLPVRWPADRVGSIVLTRKFGRPPSRSSAERHQLEFRRVPGLLRGRLNDQEFAIPEANRTDPWFVNDVVLLERNLLELEVEIGEVKRSDHTEDWGEIALVIVS